MIQPVRPSDQAYVKGLVYADSGVGKTFFLGTAQEDPRTSPMAFLDFEGNVETLAGLEIDVYPIRTWEDFADTYRILEKNVEGYRSVGIDSVTEVNLWALMTHINRRKDEVTREGKRRDIGPFGEPDQAFQSDYGDILIQMRRLLRRFRDLPMHVFYTALRQTEVRRREGTVYIPRMLGQMRSEVEAPMFVVAALVLEEITRPDKSKGVQRVMFLHDVPGFSLKVRTPWRTDISSIPYELENPTVTKLLDAVLPKKEKTNA